MNITNMREKTTQLRIFVDETIGCFQGQRKKSLQNPPCFLSLDLRLFDACKKAKPGTPNNQFEMDVW